MIDEIVSALQERGWSVAELPWYPDTRKKTPTSTLLLVAAWGLHFLLLVKQGTGKTPLSPTELAWVNSWKGIVYPVETVDQALGCLSQATMAALD